MSTNGEAENKAVEKLPEEALAEKPVKEKKPKVAKEKKPKVAKEKKPKVAKEKKMKSRKNISHPPYFQMIEEALVALKERSGSSPYAIAKFVEEKHKAELPPNFKKMLGLQLKNSVWKGKLIKIKASYKLSKSVKKPKTAVEKAVNKKLEKKATQRRPKRKSVAAVAKPKQLKSIKAPAKKKSNKTST